MGEEDMELNIDLDQILLKPFEATTTAIDRTFTGWKSLPLQHSWDDLSVFNSNFNALCKYEKFKKDYKYVVQNEQKLIKRIAAYKQYKANKAKKYAKLKKMRSSSSSSTSKSKKISSSKTKKKREKTTTKKIEPFVSFYTFPKDVYCDNKVADDMNMSVPHSPSYNDGSSAASTISMDVFEK